MKKNTFISVFAALMLAHCVTTEAAARVNLAGSVWAGNFDGQAVELTFNPDSTISATIGASSDPARVSDWNLVSVFCKGIETAVRGIPSERWKRNPDGSISAAVQRESGEVYAVTLGLAGMPDNRGRNNWYIVDGDRLTFQTMLKEEGAKFYLTAIVGNSDIEPDTDAIQVKAAGTLVTIHRVK